MPGKNKINFGRIKLMYHVFKKEGKLRERI